jgi:hypothetical protein
VLRWTKLQDFWLRLGLLKVMVAVLPTARRSQSRETVLRQLTGALFEPVRSKRLLAEAEARYGQRLDPSTSVARALLLASASPSWGQPISGAKLERGPRVLSHPRVSTVNKIVEWAQAVALIGSAYKITERGLMLRWVIDSRAAEQFLHGDHDAWNPFDLSPVERAFFLYHIGEMDAPLWYLAFALGSLTTGTEISPAHARKLTCDQLRTLTERAERTVPLSDLPKFRNVRALLSEIEAELDPSASTARRQPRRASIRAGGHRRNTTKHADHEAVPRFEQLLDLGFLTKRVPEGVRGERLERARNAWTFATTGTARRFAEAFGGESPQRDDGWHQDRFASISVASGFFPIPGRRASDVEAIAVFEDVYAQFHRPVGHTPFESIAILAMLHGLERGIVVEVTQLHAIMNRVKADGGLGGRMFFAAGNTVDRMFVLMKPGVAEAYRNTYGATVSS